MSASKQPGIFYVNSVITSPTLSHEAFTKWYDTVHIPDILKTSGIKSAYRYYAISPRDHSNPYLALYPLKDVDFLESAEFHGIPVQSEILRVSGEGSGNSFDVAGFDTRPCVLVKVVEREEGGEKGCYVLSQLRTLPLWTKNASGPAPFVVVLAFDTPGSNLEDLPFLPLEPGIRRTRLYRTHFTPKNSLPQQGQVKVQEYLALLEVETEELALAFEQTKESFKADVQGFRLLGGFGDTDAVY